MAWRLEKSLFVRSLRVLCVRKKTEPTELSASKQSEASRLALVQARTFRYSLDVHTAAPSRLYRAQIAQCMHPQTMNSAHDIVYTTLAVFGAVIVDCMLRLLYHTIHTHWQQH